jgi:hypothetical protein
MQNEKDTETEYVLFDFDPYLSNHPGLLGRHDEDGSRYVLSFASLAEAEEYAREHGKHYGRKPHPVKVGSPRYRKLISRISRPAR